MSLFIHLNKKYLTNKKIYRIPRIFLYIPGKPIDFLILPFLIGATIAAGLRYHSGNSVLIEEHTIEN